MGLMVSNGSSILGMLTPTYSTARKFIGWKPKNTCSREGASNSLSSSSVIRLWGWGHATLLARHSKRNSAAGKARLSFQLKVCELVGQC